MINTIAGDVLGDDDFCWGQWGKFLRMEEIGENETDIKSKKKVLPSMRVSH